MTPSELIAALSDPRAHPTLVGDVEVRQTHISVVFLAGDTVYKLKKPVAFGFVDFGSLDKRHTYCSREVVLNRRLAPDVYLGVVPVTRVAERLRFEGDGEAVEWAVKMRRLPDDATLLARLRRGAVSARAVEALAARIAAFHAAAEGGERVAASGRFEVVAGNARENFAQAGPWVGRTVSRPVFDRLRVRTEAELARLRPLIERRAAGGVPRDTHGDLRMDHVYLFPDRPPPGDIVVIDCVEFDDRFRHADPVADMAFLTMGLGFHGRPDLAGVFARAYFRAAGGAEGGLLLPFYSAYRAVVRAKVEGMQLDEEEVPEEARASSLRRARAHWLYALGVLEPPAHRPCVVLVGGLPGAGKSTLAAGMADRAGFRVVRSDVVRKELAGLPANAPAPAADRAGIYTPEVTERIYAECLRRAEQSVFDGHRVLVDASFGVDRHRRQFLAAAERLAVPSLFLHCLAPSDVVRHRLARPRHDPSDADWAVYRAAARRWEPFGLETASAARVVPTGDGTAEQATSRALEHLRQLGVYE